VTTTALYLVVHKDGSFCPSTARCDRLHNAIRCDVSELPPGYEEARRREP
jgi:hypothetical protein